MAYEHKNGDETRPHRQHNIVAGDDLLHNRSNLVIIDYTQKLRLSIERQFYYSILELREALSAMRFDGAAAKTKKTAILACELCAFFLFVQFLLFAFARFSSSFAIERAPKSTSFSGSCRPLFERRRRTQIL